MSMQVNLAIAAGTEEFKKLYKCVYEGHMLFLWLWYPPYSQSAARALGDVIGLDGCAVPDPDSKQDRYMNKLFQDNKDVVRQLWRQYRMTDEEKAEIAEMSRTNNSHLKQEDLVTKYPQYDMFLFLKYAALCTANHYIEGTFLNQSTSFRINMSDARLDRKMRYQQNIVHTIKKKVLLQAAARMTKKGCTAKHLTAVGTKEDCIHFCRIKKQILESEYVHEFIEH